MEKSFLMTIQVLKKLQKELQAKIDVKAQSTKKMVEALSNKIEADILEAVKKIASEKGVEVVFDKRAVLVGGLDITESVTDYLKKKTIALGDLTEEKKTDLKKDKDKSN